MFGIISFFFLRLASFAYYTVSSYITQYYTASHCITVLQRISLYYKITQYLTILPYLTVPQYSTVSHGISEHGSITLNILQYNTVTRYTTALHSIILDYSIPKYDIMLQFSTILPFSLATLALQF